MPTIIDALVVEPGLDTSGFDDEAAKARRSVEGVSNAADGAIKNFAAYGRSISRFFEISQQPERAIRRSLEGVTAPAKTAQRHLGDVSAQGRRTGSGVEAGALAGAAGLEAMGRRP